MNKTYERFKQAYIDLILSERVENMQDRIVSFDKIESELKIIFKSLKTLVDKGYDSIKYCWSVGSEAQFKGDRLNIIFEQNSLEKDTLASFNPLNNPFELCINMEALGKTCSKQDMLKFIESEDFYVLLAHEMCHYRQTFLHGVSVMKNYVAMENDGRYFDSAIELEACVFMVVEDSVLKGKKVNDFQTLMDYVDSLENPFLFTAKRMILENEEQVKKIIEYNKNFFTESTQNISENEIDFKFEMVATPVHRKRR